MNKPHHAPRRLIRSFAGLGLVSIWLAIGSTARLMSKTRKSRWDDHGTFEVTVSGQKVATETFDIHSAGSRIEAKGDIQLETTVAGKTVSVEATPDLILDEQLSPVRYSWRQEGSAKSALQATFQPAPAKVVYHTVQGKKDLREFYLPKDVVVLDDNVFAQYELLTDRYATTSGGVQTFKVFDPQEALPGTVTVSNLGDLRVIMKGKTKTLVHEVVQTDQQHLDLYLDKRGRIEEITSPSGQFTVVRQQ